MIIAFLFVLIYLLSLRNLPHSMSPHELPFGLSCKKTGLIAMLFLHCLLLLCYVVIVGHSLRYLNTNRTISSVMEMAVWAFIKTTIILDSEKS